MKETKYKFELIQKNLYSIISEQSLTYMLFIDGHSNILSPINYQSIKYSHQSNILDVISKKKHSGALFKFSINKKLFQYYVDYLRVLNFSKVKISYTELRQTFKTIEESFKEKKVNNKKLLGLHGELHTLYTFLEYGIDLTNSFQSELSETKHDIKTEEILIEIKTTRSVNRNHTFSDLEQINPDLYSEDGFIASVILEKNNLGNTLSEWVNLILMKIRPENRGSFIRKMHLLYNIYLDNPSRYISKNPILITEFHNIPKPVITDAIQSVEWQIRWESILPEKVHSVKDFVQSSQSLHSKYSHIE